MAHLYILIDIEPLCQRKCLCYNFLLDRWMGNALQQRKIIGPNDIVQKSLKS